MVSLITAKHEQLTPLCEQFGVQRLEVFGSAASASGFDPTRSDLDFLVEFHPDQDLGPWLSHYFRFREALEVLFEHPVDLVMSSAMKNPHFIREVNRTRRPLYAA